MKTEYVINFELTGFAPLLFVESQVQIARPKSILFNDDGDVRKVTAIYKNKKDAIEVEAYIKSNI